MPRFIDTVEESVVLERALSKGENLRRQFVFRTDLATAVNVIRRCNQEGKQPGPLIEEIVTDYFTTWSQGVHMTFPSRLREVLDRIAALRGCTREDVVRQIITDHSADLLAAELERDTTMQRVLSVPLPPKKPPTAKAK